MNILVVGGGGREHAIAHSLSKSPLTKKLVVAPGNPGIKKFASCYPISAEDIDGQCKLAKDINADIVFIGPEIPLVAGLKNRLSEIGINAFGPSKEAAQLEGSKTFSRNFCKRYNIPQPSFKYCNNLKTAKEQIELLNGYCVVKADGLAAGKGVVVCNTVNEAIEASSQMLEENKFGDAGKSILIEERITGIEASVFAVSDGKTAVLLGTAQDHKRAYDNNQGPNTGGMGAYSPAPILDQSVVNKTIDRIIRPTMYEMMDRGMPFTGVLYAGLMIKDSNPRLVEYNVRFGDPECQVLMMRLGGQILDALLSTAKGELGDVKINWADDHSITVVMASSGYPGSYEKGTVINGLDDLPSDSNFVCFHAGTEKQDGKIVANGGRVLNVTTRANTLIEAQKSAYQMIKNIDWPQGFYRKDIGWRGL